MSEKCPILACVSKNESWKRRICRGLKIEIKMYFSWNPIFWSKLAEDVGRHTTKIFLVCSVVCNDVLYERLCLSMPVCVTAESITWFWTQKVLVLGFFHQGRSCDCLARISSFPSKAKGEIRLKPIVEFSKFYWLAPNFLAPYAFSFTTIPLQLWSWLTLWEDHVSHESYNHVVLNVKRHGHPSLPSLQMYRTWETIVMSIH